MITTYETRATYGASMNPCTVFVVEVDGAYWYAIEGSQNVNCSPYEIERGHDLETIEDTDCFTAPAIENIEQLEREVLEYLGVTEPETDEDAPAIGRFVFEVTEFGNAAMVDDPAGEVIAALKKAIQQIELNGIEDAGMILRDSNGNKIGSISVE